MRNNNRRMIGLTVGVLLLVGWGCNLPVLPQETTGTPANGSTRAAQTLAVLMTRAAGQTATPSATFGAMASATPETTMITVTPPPPGTPTVGASPTVRCDSAGFVADVSVPDGAEILAGSPFTKTWRLKNTGTCTWTPDYALVFESGDSLGGAAAQKIGKSVAPNETFDLSVALQAPGQPGSYRGNWKLRNAAGVLFGIGAAQEHFYVVVKVVPAGKTSGDYSFTANYCLAEWTATNPAGGADNTLSCAGKDGAAEGFVLYKDKPILETGYVDDEAALLTNPPKINDGVIRGKFPSYSVQAGDHFRAIIGCEGNAANCSVRFSLDYAEGDGAPKNLASWNESFDGAYTVVDQDLSALAGKTVRFYLSVSAVGESKNDRAQWLAPRIER